MFWEALDIERWFVAVHDQVAALEKRMRETVSQALTGDGPASAAETPEGEYAAVGQTIRLLRLDATTLYLTDAVNQLGRALRSQDRLPVEFEDLFERTRVLRNVYEHWDETRANFERPDDEAVKSVEAYKLAHPGEKP